MTFNTYTVTNTNTYVSIYRCKLTYICTTALFIKRGCEQHNNDTSEYILVSKYRYHSSLKGIAFYSYILIKVYTHIFPGEIANFKARAGSVHSETATLFGAAK